MKCQIRTEVSIYVTNVVILNVNSDILNKIHDDCHQNNENLKNAIALFMLGIQKQIRCQNTLEFYIQFNYAYIYYFKMISE